jgi:peptidoglycan hydrolase-like protein with peptidoglycan-binding domain
VILNNASGFLNKLLIAGIVSAMGVGAFLFLPQSALADAPTITGFALPSTSASRLVAVTTFTATASSSVADYLINASSTTPSAINANWASTTPSVFLFDGTGTQTAYAWVKDQYGTISASASSTVTITPSFDSSDFSNPVAAGFFSQSFDTLAHWPSGPFSGIRLWLQTPATDWGSVETSRGIYDWSGLDAWLSVAGESGVDVLYTFGNTPNWASLRPDETCSVNGGGGCAAPPSDVDSGDNIWKEYVTALVEHSLASDTHIKYYELWNEPNLSGFWTGTDAQLVTMENDAYTIIHTLDPSAKVVGPSPTGINAATWLDGFFSAGGATSQDIVGYHPYLGSTNIFQMSTLIDNIEAEMTLYGISGKPLWGTEGSWGSATNLTPDQEQAWVAKTYVISWMKGVARDYWYSWDGGVWGPLWNSVSGVQPSGTAYTQIYNWLAGAYRPSTNPCYQTIDSTYHCYLTLADGNPAEIVWNDAATTTLSIGPSFTSYLTLDNSTENAVSGNSVTVGTKPDLLVVNDIVPRKTDSWPAPAVTDFVMNSSAASATTTSAVVPVSVFRAYDQHNTVADYLITESAVTPSVSNSNWAPVPPTIFTFSGIGTRTAYAWVKDANGEISNSASQTVAITLQAPTNVYYSVGQTSTDLKIGSPAVTITGGAAVFSSAQTGNIGVGDEVTYASGQIAYISGKTSSDQHHWTLETATGGVPADVTNATVTSITRAYTSLEAAVTGATDSDHLNGSDLAELNVILNFPCYYDTGPDTGSGVRILNTDITTPTNYIQIYTPIDTVNQVNKSQRHDGAWTASGAYEIDTTGQYAIRIDTNYARIIGMQVSATISGSFARTLMFDGISGSGGYIILDSNILRATMVGAPSDAEGIGFTSPPAGPNATITNNVIYGYTGNSLDAGMYLKGLGTYFVYNNTVYNSYDGFLSTRNGTTQVPIVFYKNDLAQDTIAGYSTSFTTIGTSTNNLSDHADAPGSNTQTSKTISFINPSNGDFHLLYSDTAALDKGVDLSADANYAFTNDIDGQTRPYNSVWDIGADEYEPSAPTITSFTIPSTSSSLSVPITTLAATSASSTITGYLVTETNSAPSLSDSGWCVSAPSTFTFSADGNQTAYAWVKDNNGNISTSTSAAVVITIPVVSSGGGGGGGPVSGPLSQGYQNSASSTATSTSNTKVAQATVSNGHTSAISIPLFTRDLTLGISGLDVKALQKFLNANGFVLTPSGAGSPGQETDYFGSLTQAALSKFQAANNISPASGYFGPVTRALIDGQQPTSATSATPSPSVFQFSSTLVVGSSDFDVTELQNVLSSLDFYTGPITGYYGILTEAAVEKYQAAKGIPQIGIVGPLTRAALNTNVFLYFTQQQSRLVNVRLFDRFRFYD